MPTRTKKSGTKFICGLYFMSCRTAKWRNRKAEFRAPPPGQAPRSTACRTRRTGGRPFFFLEEAAMRVAPPPQPPPPPQGIGPPHWPQAAARVIGGLLPAAALGDGPPPPRSGARWTPLGRGAQRRVYRAASARNSRGQRHHLFSCARSAPAARTGGPSALPCRHRPRAYGARATVRAGEAPPPVPGERPPARLPLSAP